MSHLKSPARSRRFVTFFQAASGPDHNLSPCDQKNRRLWDAAVFMGSAENILRADTSWERKRQGGEIYRESFKG